MTHLMFKDYFEIFGKWCVIFAQNSCTNKTTAKIDNGILHHVNRFTHRRIDLSVKCVHQRGKRFSWNTICIYLFRIQWVQRSSFYHAVLTNWNYFFFFFENFTLLRSDCTNFTYFMFVRVSCFSMFQCALVISSMSTSMSVLEWVNAMVEAF